MYAQVTQAAALGTLLVTGCGWSAPSADAAASEIQPDTTIVVRRVAETAPYAVFPDGRRLVVVDTAGNLLVEDVATRERLPLTTDGSWMEGRWPETASVSPDGGRVAIGWYDEGVIDIRLVRADGSATRSLLRRDGREGWLGVADWSPDGSAVLVLLEDPTRGQSLLRVDAESGTVAEVHDFGWRRPDLPKYSTDGRLLALTLQSTDETSSRDLHVLDPASGELSTVVDLDESVRLADWAPNGGGLYFVTERDGVATLWRQRLSGRRAAGAPERIRGDLARLRPLEYAGGGLYFTANHREIGIRHAQLTSASDGTVAPPAVLVDRAPAWVTAITWSPDAQHLAYMLNEPLDERQIVVRSRTSGEERVFAPAIALDNGLDWRDDGLFVMGASEGRRRLYRLDFNAGRLVEVEDLEASGAVRLPALSSNGSVRLLVRRGETPASPRQLVVTNRAAGTERVLLERRAIGTARISPDGRHVALIDAEDQSRLVLYSTTSGDDRVLYQAPGESWMKGGSLAWTPDGRAVLVLEQHVSEGQTSSRFRRIGLDGSVTEVLNAGGAGGAVSFGLSPDGRHLAYTSAAEDEPRTEGWVVEGLERF